MQLTAPTRQAIAKAMEQGIHVTLATGRSFHSAKKYADRLKLDVPLICANGGMIRHRDGSIMSETNFDNKIIAPLLAEMQAEDLYFQVYHRDGIIANVKRTSLTSWVQMICENKLKPANLAYSVREFFQSRVRKDPGMIQAVVEGRLDSHKVFAIGKLGSLEKIFENATERGLSADYYLGYKNHMYLEIAPPGISKGWALQKLARHLELDMEQVVAIGDNLNDRTMIQAAGLGIVMGNGPSQLKKLAGRVTLSNDQDGVAAAFNSIILPASDSQRAV